MKKMQLSTLLKISLLGAISFVVMQFDFSVGFAPEFYKMDLSDLPALIGAFSMGPLAGVLIELVKNVLHAFQTNTFGVGEFANFASGAIFVGVAGLIYMKNKTRKGAIIGMAVGTLTMGLVGSVLNYYVLIPFYSQFMPIEQIIGMAQLIFDNVFAPLANKLGMGVDDVLITKKTLVIYMVFPFNLLKGLLVSIITLPLYKRLSSVLSK